MDFAFLKKSVDNSVWRENKNFFFRKDIETSVIRRFNSADNVFIPQKNRRAKQKIITM